MSDVSFRIDCTELPVDHSAELAKSLCSQQSWIQELEGTGVHPIHVAGSQNGWQRPDGSDQSLLLSKRTRLRIRIDSNYTDKLIDSLEGTNHRINGHTLKILNGSVATLKPSATLFSRYTVYLDDQARAEKRADKGAEISDANWTEDSAGKNAKNSAADEQALVMRVVSSCGQLGYTPGKILCGRSATISTDNGLVMARSVLLADVPAEYSLLLQDKGLGDLRLTGCGLLIPHKDTGAVN